MLSCSQGGRGRKGRAGEWFHVAFPYIFLRTDKKTGHGGVRPPLPGPTELVLITAVQSWSCGVPAHGPMVPCSPLCLSYPGREPGMALSHVPLVHSSGLFYLFQAPFLPNSIFILSTFTASSHFHHLSSLDVLIFLILSHPSLSSHHKQRTKATK